MPHARKFQAALAALVVLTSGIAGGTAPANAAIAGDYSYDVSADDLTATVLAYSGDSGPVTVPAELGGLPVAAIGAAAFLGRGVTSVVLPAAVLAIGAAAFDSNPLVSVSLLGDAPMTVTAAGEIGASFGAGEGLTLYFEPESSGWTTPWWNGYRTEPGPVPVEHVLTFDSNGGSAVDRVVVADGAVASPPVSPVLPGYEFIGWYIDGALAASFDFLEPVWGSATLYAKWAAKSYDIVFDGNGATDGSMAPHTATYGVSTALPPNEYSRAGFAFVGWNTAPNRTGDPFDDAATIQSLTVEDAVTLYAQWVVGSAGSPFKKTPSIAMTGEAVTGSTVKLKATGVWSPLPKQSSVDIQTEWLLDGAVVATGSSFLLPPDSVGKRLSVQLVATAAGGYGAVVQLAVAKRLLVRAGFDVRPAPVMLLPPGVGAGQVAVGTELTAVQAGAEHWVSTPDSVGYQWYRGSAKISNATSATYKVTKSDIGKALSVRATAKRSGLVSATPTSSALIVPKLFARAPKVSIVGTAARGFSVTAKVSGAWSPSASSSFQWACDGAAIEGAVASVLALTSAEVGCALTVELVGAKAGYLTKHVKSPAKTVLDVFDAQPTPEIGLAEGVVAATVTAGTLLTAIGAAASDWEVNADTVTYQWYRGSSKIKTATKAQYQVVSADFGKQITVRVTASRVGFLAATRVSTALLVPRHFTKAPNPSISGAALSGSTLTAIPGRWSPTASTFSYQWLRGGVPIDGATTSTYRLGADDTGPDNAITVRVTAHRAGYFAQTKVSAAKVVPAEFLAAPAPTIGGTASVGSALSAAVGSWHPVPTKVAYQWYRNGVAISGATKASYTAVWADIQKSLTVRVTASRVGYQTTVRTSTAVTVPVPAKPADKNCSDFKSKKDAQAFFDKWYPFYGDFADLDRDNDMKACE